MRNVFYSFLMLMLAVCSSCSQEQEKSKAAEEKVAQEALIYELFETHNVWTFIKLDTRNGKMTQVHYALDSESYRGEVELNTKSLIKGEGKPGRFTLYPTQNMFNFILLDKVSGSTYQVQWSMKEDTRMVAPIGESK